MEYYTLLENHDQVTTTVQDTPVGLLAIVEHGLGQGVAQGPSDWVVYVPVTTSAQAVLAHVGWTRAWQLGDGAPPSEALPPERWALSENNPLEIQTQATRDWVAITALTDEEATFAVYRANDRGRLQEGEPLVTMGQTPAEGITRHDLFVQAVQGLRPVRPADERAWLASQVQTVPALFLPDDEASRPSQMIPTLRDTVGSDPWLVLSVLPEGHRLGQWRLIDQSTTPSVTRSRVVYPPGTPDDVIRARHEAVVAFFTQESTVHPTWSRSDWAHHATSLARGEELGMSSPETRSIHPEADTFRVGAVDPHVYVVWKEPPGRPPVVFRGRDHQADWPMLFVSPEDAQAYFDDWHGVQVPHLTPSDTVPPSVERSVKQALGGVRKTIPHRASYRVAEPSVQAASPQIAPRYAYGPAPSVPGHPAGGAHRAQSTFILWKENPATGEVALKMAHRQGTPCVMEWQSDFALEQYARREGYPPLDRTTPSEAVRSAYAAVTAPPWVVDAPKRRTPEPPRVTPPVSADPRTTEKSPPLTPGDRPPTRPVQPMRSGL